MPNNPKYHKVATNHLEGGWGCWKRGVGMKFIKFGWFILGDSPLGKGTLIIGVVGQIEGGLNAGVGGTNVGTFATSTWGAGVTSFAIGSMIGALWEQFKSSYSAVNDWN